MESRRVAVLGGGDVGRTLASGLLAHGHTVVLGSRDPRQPHVMAWLAEEGPAGLAATYDEAAAWADIVFLCVPGHAVEEAVALAGADTLAGKIVVDVTNGASAVDDHMMLDYGTDASAAERVQRAAPEAFVVKAFNTVGIDMMVDPVLPGGPPTMPTCGNDAAAKAVVAEMLGDFGWEATDLGDVSFAAMLEAMGAMGALRPAEPPDARTFGPSLAEAAGMGACPPAST